MDRDRLRRYRAERLLRGQLAAARPRVMRVARKRLWGHGVRLDDGDLEECYLRAWHGLYAALVAGRQIEDYVGWLVVATVRRALEDSRSLVFQATELSGTIEGVMGGDAARDSDLAATLDSRRRLRELFEALRMSLTAREREAVTLCYLHGFSRAEAAARMGISQTRMRKLMDGVGGRRGLAGKWGQLLIQIGADGWCEQQGSLIRAYALGVLDAGGERHGWAVKHLDECPGCRAMAAALRDLAVVLPPLPVPRPASPFLSRVRSGRSSLSAVSGKGGTLALKLAATGALVAAGGGYALLAGSAPGHPARTTTIAHLSPAHLNQVKQVAKRHASPVRRTRAPARVHVPSLEPRPVVAVPTRPAQPLNEFTPERTPRSRVPTG